MSRPADHGVEPPESFGQVLPAALLSLDRTLVEVNAAFCRLVGRSREDLLGRPFEDVTTDGRGQQTHDLMRAAVAAGQASGQVERTVGAADGTSRAVQAAWTLVRDQQGVPWAATLVLVDLTDRLRGAAALARSQAWAQVRFERSAVPQVMTGLAGDLTAVNDAFCSLVGRQADALVGRSITDLTHAQDGGRADAELARVLAGEVDSARYERLLADAQGRALPVLVDVTLLRDEQGQPDAVASIVFELRTLRDAERRREQQEQLFLAVSRRASDVALVTDAEGQVLFASAATQHVTGYQPEDLLARTSWDLVHPDDLAAARALYRRVLDSGGTGTSTARVRVADGSWRWFEQTVADARHTAVGGLVVNLRDVHQRVTAEHALRASEARYRTIADTAEEGVWVVAPDGTTLYANARLASILALPLEEVYARPATSLFDAQEAEQVAARLRGRQAQGPERYEVGYPHPDGTERRLWISASPLHGPDGSYEGSLGMVSDVTLARQSEAQLRRAALHDALTGLPNRTLLHDRLEQAVTRRDVAGSGQTALLLLDLDGFKLVNDSLGHAVGDSLLVAVAERLQAHARARDTVARLGGDEFVLVCEDVDEPRAERLADDLLAALHVPFEVEGQVLHVSASVGVAVSPGAGAQDLLRFADAAMYAAKSAGRGRTAVFDRTLADEAERRHALSGQLRAALTEDGLGLQYQPLVDLATGRVAEVEALARWHHAELGEVSPTVFVPVAEQTGLSGQLNDWALRRAVRDLTGLRERGLVDADLRVSVNLSALSLADSGLEEHVVAVVEQAGLRPSALTLEITETAIMADAERTVRLLRRLRRRGFGVAMDDFGTGYSSLAYLRDLPISSIKIDRSFVTGIVEDRDALAIVASIVDLARAVDVQVVAEGVETPEQAAVLRRLGCTTGQGWLWSPALRLDQMAQAASTWRSGYTVGPARAPRMQRKQQEGWAVLPEHGLDRLLTLHREGASLSTIAAALNSEGFRAPSGVRWHRTTVARSVAEVAYPDLSIGGGGPDAEGADVRARHL